MTFSYRMAQSVRIMMAAAIFLSYGLQFYVPMNIVWPYIKSKLSSENALKYGETITRFVLISTTCKFLPGFNTMYINFYVKICREH